MVVAMANKSGHQISPSFVTKFIASLGIGVAAYYGGCKAANWLFHLIPGAGTLIAMGVSSVMNAIFTYKVAAALSGQLDSGKFNSNDAQLAAAAIITIVCHLPTVSEIKDMIDIKG